MIINLLEDFILLFFIFTSVVVILRERKTRLGLLVKEGDKEYTKGKQGLVTTIGRCLSSDVRLHEKSVSRTHAAISYDAKTKKYDLTEYGKAGNCASGYYIANHLLNFSLPNEPKCFEYGYIPSLICTVFVALQAISAFCQWRDYNVLIPYVVIIAYMVFSYYSRADKQPITESVFSILLTYYIEAVMYPATTCTEDYKDCLKSAVLGVSIYICFCIAMKLFLYADMDRFALHNIFRWVAVVAIAALIVMNLILATPINGAYNWVFIGGLSFQPSEVIKVLLAFCLIVPIGKKFYSAQNLLIEIGLPIICFVYALIIKDIGVLLQFGVIFVAAVLIQNTNILYSILMIVSGIFGCNVVLKISSTASYRFESWLGENNTILESLTAKEIFANPYDYGYQSIHALVAAFKNGAIFGNKSFDVMKGIEAANSDLVMSIISQKHGFIVIYIILALYVILLANMLLSFRQQNKTQQMFSILSVTLMTFAMALNLCGTFGIVALTGIVSPALSNGISSAISYGCLFGVISSSALTKKYIKEIKDGKVL